MVTLLSKPNCTQCDLTKMVFEREGVEYLERNMMTDDEALAMAKDLGYLSAPVVITPEDHWSGFQPERIKNI